MDIDIPVKACPFCGGNNITLELAVNNRLWVKCFGCTATAWLEDWNARADHIPDTSKMMWISVDDRLPDEFTRVLASIGRRLEVLQLNGDSWECEDERFLRMGAVTHWMRLPEPPSITES